MMKRNLLFARVTAIVSSFLLIFLVSTGCTSSDKKSSEKDKGQANVKKEEKKQGNVAASDEKKSDENEKFEKVPDEGSKTEEGENKGESAKLDGPSKTTAAQLGDTVEVHYVLTVEGKVVDKSEGRGPLTFKIGNKEVIPGFEMGVVGMKSGDEKIIDVKPIEGYGPYRKDLIETVPKDQFPDAILGKVVGMKHYKTGELRKGKVVSVDDKSVKVDLNHPLAGKTLNFKVKLVSVH